MSEFFSSRRTVLEKRVKQLTVFGLVAIALIGCGGSTEANVPDLPAICANQARPEDQRACSFDQLPYEIDNQVAVATARAEVIGGQSPTNTPEPFVATCTHVGDGGNVSGAHARLAPTYPGNPAALAVFRNVDNVGDVSDHQSTFNPDDPDSWPGLVQPSDIVCLTSDLDVTFDPSFFLTQ